MFIAPATAAVVSSSVQQYTDGMLNLFITDKAALNALSTEYERYLLLCRPLMRILTDKNPDEILKSFENIASAEGNAYICSAMPPIFTIPENVIDEISVRNGNNMLISAWKRTVAVFR